MRVLKVNRLASENCLEPLLDGLLGVKAENGVRNLDVSRELSQGNGILGGPCGPGGPRARLAQAPARTRPSLSTSCINVPCTEPHR